jgi:uncharacterized membrane protein (DUF106 family)
MNITPIINQTVSNITTTVSPYIPLTISPLADVYCITLVTAFYTTLVTKYLSDQKAIKALRKEVKDLQKRMRETMAKDPKKATQLQQELMKKNFENMKYAFNLKIMLVTAIPMIFVFLLVKQYYGPLGEFWNFFGLTQFGWFGTYLIFSILNSILLKKIMDVA